MTSLLADKSVIIRIKIIMNFMNEIITPPCNSLLATFLHQLVKHVRRQCDLRCGSEFVPSGHEISCSSCCLNVPEEKMAGERGEESPVGGLERLVEVGGVCEAEAGTGVDVEDVDQDVDVGCGVDEVGLSGYESEGFTLSEILRRNRLGKNVSERVIDTAHLPQCEFSNLHLLPLAFSL